MTRARTDRLREARELFAARHWADACTHLEAADDEEPLGSDDLERLAAAQYLIGHELKSIDTTATNWI